MQGIADQNESFVLPLIIQVCLRKLRNQLSSGGDEPEKHQFCIDAWIIYNNHLEDLDEPRTGGGLKSNKRNFEAEDYYFSGRHRPPRVQQQVSFYVSDST